MNDDESKYEDFQKIASLALTGSCYRTKELIASNLGAAKVMCENSKRMSERGLEPEYTIMNCTMVFVLRKMCSNLITFQRKLFNEAHNIDPLYPQQPKHLKEALEFWRDIEGLVNSFADACEQCYVKKYGKVMGGKNKLEG